MLSFSHGSRKTRREGKRTSRRALHRHCRKALRRIEPFPGNELRPHKGLDWARMSSGRWLEILPGVYRIAGTPRSWPQDLMAVCLWGGAGTAASHRAAAALWELEGFREGILECSTDRRIRRGELDLVIHRATLRRFEVTSRGRIPVTTPARTLLDLGSVASPDAVERALEDALRKRLTTVSRLTSALERSGGRGRRGTGVLKRLLDPRGSDQAALESALELELRRLLKKARLPEPVRQFEIRDGDSLIARVDFAYPELRLAIEADGYRYHSGRSAWQRDVSRRNQIVMQGWRVVNFTSEDLRRRPLEAIAQIRRALADPSFALTSGKTRR